MAVRRSAIPVSVELTESAVPLWEFLKLIDNYPWLYEGLHVHNAVRRYEKLWLPLAARIDPDYLLSAPLDIEWVWYVHMLSPYAYHRDCLHRFGKVIHHRIVSTREKNIGLNFAREMWEKSYRHEEFSLDLTAPPKISGTFTSKFSYDLFSAISRQRFFNYQVALKHYSDTKFLERAVKRYKDFLCARLQHPTLLLNGCFDVQIIWHVHMSFPMMYRDDTRKIFGEMLSHYDTEDGSGSVTWTSSPARERNTTAPKPIPGAMYRGEAMIFTAEKILLTQKQTELTFKVKLLKEEFQHTVAIATSQARDLMLTPCWFELPSLTLDCTSHVINITNGKSDKVYNVKVTHSVAPVLSTVEVVHPKDYLIATAHTIAGKQIPMRSQLDGLRHTCCAYTPEANERALLIRSQKDWGICVGKWVGNSESGELIISFFNMETNEWQSVNHSTTSTPETTVFEVKICGEDQSVFINLASGLVTVPCNDIATFIPEIIALTYSIGVLYVLCRERTREFYPVDPFQTTEQKSLQPCHLSKQIKASRTTKRDGVFSTGSMGKKSLWLNRDPFVSNLLLATGRNCSWAPSNSFLRFFHENVTRVFEHCTLSSDDRATVEALLEIEYLLEYLGVKESKVKSQGKQKKRITFDNESEIGNGLKASKDRFSNVELNERIDEMVDGGGNEKRKGKKDERKGERREEKREGRRIGVEDEMIDERRDGRRDERRDERMDDVRNERGTERRDERKGERREEKREGRRNGVEDEMIDGRRDGRRDERMDDLRNERGTERTDERKGERREEKREGRRNVVEDEMIDERRDGRRDERMDDVRNERGYDRGDEWREDKRKDKRRNVRENEMIDERRDGRRDDQREMGIDDIRNEKGVDRRDERRNERGNERKDEWREDKRKDDRRNVREDEMIDGRRDGRRDERREMRIDDITNEKGVDRRDERRNERGDDMFDRRRDERSDERWEDGRYETALQKTVHYSDQESYFV